MTCLERHPAVIDGANWDSPTDPVAELAVRNRNAVGAGELVRTGPQLVTKENAAAIAALAAQGTR